MNQSCLTQSGEGQVRGARNQGDCGRSLKKAVHGSWGMAEAARPPQAREPEQEGCRELKVRDHQRELPADF